MSIQQSIMRRTLALCMVLSLALVSCQSPILQTVETGDQLLQEQDPKYKFSRNQESSVDIQEAELLLATFKELNDRFFDQAYILTSEQMSAVRTLWDRGLYGYAPRDYIARSSKHGGQRGQILSDLDTQIASVARISGLGSDNPGRHRRREAQPGQTGYIDGERTGRFVFADEQGLVVSQSLKAMILGAMNIDQILNVHLDEAVVSNRQLIDDHEHQVLIKGRNYTALEHHWDLAYGYYLQGLRAWAMGNGIRALRETSRRLDLAFTLGRIDIGYHLYDMLPQHVETIRREIAVVIKTRIKHLLIGGNTMANLREHAPFAFPMLSDAYGLIYCLQFLRDPRHGKPYFSYQEVQAMLHRLLRGRGFWDHELLDQELSKLVGEIEQRMQ